MQNLDIKGNLVTLKSAHWIARVIHNISPNEKCQIVSMHVGCMYKYICDLRSLCHVLHES